MIADLQHRPRRRIALRAPRNYRRNCGGQCLQISQERRTVAKQWLHEQLAENASRSDQRRGSQHSSLIVSVSFHFAGLSICSQNKTSSLPCGPCLTTSSSISLPTLGPQPGNLELAYPLNHLLLDGRVCEQRNNQDGISPSHLGRNYDIEKTHRHS